MFIYMVQNNANGKIYIGKTSNPKLQSYFATDIRYALAGRIGKRHLYNAIRKYGADKFSCIPLVSFAKNSVSNKESGEIEKYYIKCFRSTETKIGYNITPGGDGATGFKWSDGSRKKLSLRMRGNTRGRFAAGRPSNSGTFKVGHKGIPNSGCFRAGHTLGKGRKVSEETKAKMSDRRKGKRLSPNTEFKKGMTPWNKGLPMSPEQREKMSGINIGRKASDEARKNMSRARTGRSPSAETRKKIGDAQRGRKLSTEHKAKLSVARLGKIPSAEARRRMSEAQKNRHRLIK